MIKKSLVLSVITLAAGALAFAAARAQAPEQLQPMEQHKKLLASVGEWEGTMTMSMPGAPATPTPAKETVEAIGEYWTVSRFTCDMMGTPYVGTGPLGYDPLKKKFVGTWIDSMSSQFSVMEGEMDAKTNTLVMRWTAVDAMSGKPAPHRYEAVHSGDTVTTTFYMGDGAGTKTMVTTMKKKGAKPATAK